MNSPEPSHDHKAMLGLGIGVSIRIRIYDWFRVSLPSPSHVHNAIPITVCTSVRVVTISRMHHLVVLGFNVRVRIRI